ncbi:MAG: molybdopterin-dependent oxidoreductase [Deltaproteobacteria bacterium]|nr:molybdopterin-dependent oxidoreductase [Deltaproteobacteria bacterium]
MNTTIVGQSLPLIDGVEKVTGRGVYGVDVRVPGMVFARILRSPYAHARIVQIDASKAEKIQGVHAVVTCNDLPDRRVGLALKDEYVLARDKVRYAGEAVAAVAAVDLETADEALKAIQVEYQELTPVFDAREALREDAPRIHEDLANYQQSAYITRFIQPIPNSNVASHIKLRKGDIEAGFLQADVVLEDTFYCPRIHHCYMEPHAVLAEYTPEKIAVWSNGQRPFDIRTYMADLFGLPMSKVRVINTMIGGGFGGKITAKLEPIAVALSRKSQRPVKLVLNRQEEFQGFGGAHSAWVKIKSGATKNGKLTAREMEVIWDAGAAADLGVSVALLAGVVGASGPYRIPNLKLDSYLVYTNKVNPTALRGMGMQQVSWAVESQTDMLAEKLGIDPIEFRMRNALEEGDRSATGEVLESVSVKECLKKVADAMEWGSKPKAANQGRAICVWHKFSAPATTSSAAVKVNADGSVTLLTGSSEIGQGSKTVLAQIAAEELGVSLEEVSVISGDTDATPFDHGSFSSRVTHHTGNAVKFAAEDARGQILNLAAEMMQPMEITPEALDLRDHRVFVRSLPDTGLPLAEVALAAQIRYGKPILGKGSFRGQGSHRLDPETGQSNQPAASEWIYVAQGVDIEVDPESGVIKVLKLIGAYDCGKAINPLAARGQIIGGVMMGVGLSLYEEMHYEDGQNVNPNFMDYMIPTISEAPPMEVILVENPHPLGPYGAKGIGEASIVLIPAAIGNALYNATGVRLRELPLTPDRVLNAIEAKR